MTIVLIKQSTEGKPEKIATVCVFQEASAVVDFLHSLV